MILVAICVFPARPPVSAQSAATQILFASDLEDENPSCWASRRKEGCGGWTDIHDAAVIGLCANEMAHSGRKALKITYVKNENYGGTWRAVDARHVFTRFYDYYDEDFDFAAGMKIHRFSGFNVAKQKNDFDIILQSKADDPASNYCGLTDAKYLALSYNGGPVDWGSLEGRFTFKRGRWYCIETEVKLNTPGASDGELRIWIDGRLFAEKTGINLVGDLKTPINGVLFGGWYSNSAAGKNPCPDPIKTSIRYVDDPAIATAYIGPMPTVAAGPAPGSRTVSCVLPWPGSFQIEYEAVGSGAADAKGADAGSVSSTSSSTRYANVTPVVNSPSVLHSLVLTGLDTGKVYHYRLKSTWNNGYHFLSPDYVFSTAKEAPLPEKRKPARAPATLTRKEHDPIPD